MNETLPFGTFSPSLPVNWVLRRLKSLPNQWWAKRLGFLLRRVIIGTLQGKPLDIETLGAKMRLYPYNNVCEKRILFTPQFFDPLERGYLEKRITPNFIFIDIGANIGAYALFVSARAGAGARILAVEPQPVIFDRLSYNIQQNPFGTIKAVACAIADKSGELTLFLDPKNHGESSVKIVGSGHSQTLRVPALTLEDLILTEGYSHVDAIKLDVEGAEDIILEPFLNHAPFALFPQMIMLENGHGRWSIDLVSLMEAKGYELVLKTPLNLIYERKVLQ